ncbi:hypothetical protein CC78DRAFT_575204 [Lojkania enalia]|uniref:Zn(2)-C6 fungal-type domain-containing protein n=1 Tax=Lojkania enalia TaxID=147567 RepID=A0A9P4N9I7_9PLEO|nr:hypothetical protein CC78DRAFT_575204 [Didymosphaeria enalia]
MVGVPKSTGCFCDETWPACLNCQKNKKECPGPPARHTFKDSGPKLNCDLTSFASDDSQGISQQPCKKLNQLNEKWSNNGAVFQKFRISSKPSTYSRQLSSAIPRCSPSGPSFRTSILRFSSPSQHQELCRTLIDAMCIGDVGYRLSGFGAFMHEIPARIGQNAALDAAVACLVRAHSSMIHKRPATEIVSPSLYLKAVRELQLLLEDPREGRSPNTLCAAVLLGLVEALAGPRLGNKYLTHVGGAGRLIELQGPQKCNDPFAREILRFNRGGIIITSIYARKPCFLMSLEWRHIAFDSIDNSLEDRLYTKVLQLMASFPGLLKELKDLECTTFDPFPAASISEFDAEFRLDEFSDTFSQIDFSDDFASRMDVPLDVYPSYESCVCSIARSALLGKLQSLKKDVRTLADRFNVNLADAAIATEHSSTMAPTPTSFHFSNWRIAAAYNCLWSLMILINKVVMNLLPPYEPNIYALEAECRAVALEICKTWEDAWANKPIGAFHTTLSFVMAYEFCTPPIQVWIMKSLNALLDSQQVSVFRWTDAMIRKKAAKLVGEGLGVAFG